MFTQQRHQTLANQAGDECSIRQKVAINTEMLHTTQGADRALGVQGRQHQVAGFTGENGGEKGIQVTDLTVQDGIRIETKCRGVSVTPGAADGLR